MSEVGVQKRSVCRRFLGSELWARWFAMVSSSVYKDLKLWTHTTDPEDRFRNTRMLRGLPKSANYAALVGLGIRAMWGYSADLLSPRRLQVDLF